MRVKNLGFLFLVLILIFSIFYLFQFVVALHPFVDLELNVSVLHKGEAFKASVQWNDTVNFTWIEYNSTAPELVNTSYRACGAACPGNWTNFSVSADIDWLPGVHQVKIYVNDSAGIENSTNAKTFILWGWSKSSISLNTSFLELGEAVNITCKVMDANTSNTLADYYVEIYNYTTKLASGTTDTNGLFSFSLVPPQTRSDTFELTCAIYDNVTQYYNASYNDTALLKVGIPINKTTGTGGISAILGAHETTYHSYFFNTSAIENATSVAIFLNWTNSSNDIDLFLFDSAGKFLDKSVARNPFPENWKELISFNYPPKNEIWEIRVYGDISTSEAYNLFLTFITLNATDSTTGELLRLIDFGNLNVTDKRTMNITLENIGNLIFKNASRFPSFFPPTSSEAGWGLYHEDVFSASEAGDFYFVVPSGVAGVIVSVNWTGAAKYNLTVFDHRGIEVGNSFSKRANANISAAMQEEFVRINSITPPGGLWKARVENTTLDIDPYTVKAQVWFPEEGWIATNYTTFTFNSSGLPNSSLSFQFNFTIPSFSMSGIYKGDLLLASSAGNLLKIPFKVNVTTPELVVNNLLASKEIGFNENIGFNRTITLKLPINNTGNRELTFIEPTDSGFLNLTTTEYMPLNFSSPSSIPAKSSGILEINISIETTKTKNKVGIYSGEVKLNTSDATMAHPYRDFTLKLKVNLTDELKVSFWDLTTEDGNMIKENATTDENVTFHVKVFLVNGSNLEGLTLDNFINPYLLEGNVSYRIPSTGYLSRFNGSTSTAAWVNGPYYKVNVTIPGNSPGGQYRAFIDVNYSASGVILKGSSSFFPLIINETGLWMEFIGSPPTTLLNGTSGVVNVSIKNYGLLQASDAKIKISPGALLTASYLTTSCSITGTPSAEVTFALAGYNPTGCWIAWKVTAGQTNGTTTSNITGIAGKWYNWLKFDTTVTKPAEIITIPPPTYVADLEFIKAEKLIMVEQNSTNSTIVEVKNTGNKTLDVTFSIEHINTTWYSLNDTSERLEPNKIAAFKVTFTIGDVEFKDYAGKYKAASPEKTITQDFTLRVLPSEKSKLAINAALEEFKLNYTQLSEEINQTKAKGLNVTLAEQKLTQLKSKIQEAESYIVKGDYTSAYNLFNAIRLLIKETKAELEKAKEKALIPTAPAIPWNLIIPIVIGVIVAIFLAYLFWPVKPGYKSEEKIFIKEKEIAPGRKLKKIKAKIKAFKLRSKEAKEVKKPEEMIEEEWRKLYEKYKKKS